MCGSNASASEVSDCSIVVVITASSFLPPLASLVVRLLDPVMVGGQRRGKVSCVRIYQYGVPNDTEEIGVMELLIQLHA